MSDDTTQNAGAPKTQPLTRTDAILKAWSQVCRLPIESLATPGEDARARALPGIAVHLLRNDIGMSPDEVAVKLGVPTTYVRLLSIETSRALVNREPTMRVKARIGEIRRVVRESFGHAVKQGKSRGGQRKPRPAPIDETVGMDVIRKVSSLFNVKPEELLAQGRCKREEATWARMTVIALLHRVVPKAQIPAIAHFLDMSEATMYAALARIGQVATSTGYHVYKQPIEKACILFGATLDALKRQ